MTIETLALLASVAAGIVAAVAGLAATYYGRKSSKASNEELVLAREQASRIPSLVLTSAELLPLHADTDLAEEINEMREIFEEIEERKRQKEEERHKQEEERRRQEEAEKKRQGEIIQVPVDDADIPPRIKKQLENQVTQARRMWNENLAAQRAYSRIMPSPNLVNPSPSAKSEPYEGPLPDTILEILVKNQGRATAYEVTTWLTLDKSELEPVDYFAAKGVDVISEEEDKVTVEIQAQREGGRLLPSENDWHRFQIPVLRHKAEGSTLVSYEITSPQGGVAKDETELPLYISEEAQEEPE